MSRVDERFPIARLDDYRALQAEYDSKIRAKLKGATGGKR